MNESNSFSPVFKGMPGIGEKGEPGKPGPRVSAFKSPFIHYCKNVFIHSWNHRFRDTEEWETGRGILIFLFLLLKGFSEAPKSRNEESCHHLKKFPGGEVLCYSQTPG